MFVSALRDALLAKEIDFAVHSYKDLPTAPADGLIIAAVPVRDDPRDALVARDGADAGRAAAGARIGTGALRRVAQLQRARPRASNAVPMRGNVDTRLRKLAEGEFDAVVLARAGLRRLGRADEITEILDPMLMLPAPAQGALAVECRTGDTDLVELLAQPRRRSTPAPRSPPSGRCSPTLEAGCARRSPALADVVARPTDGTAWRDLSARCRVQPGRQLAVRLSGTGTLTDAAGWGRGWPPSCSPKAPTTYWECMHDPHP